MAKPSNTNIRPGKEPPVSNFDLAAIYNPGGEEDEFLTKEDDPGYADAVSTINTAGLNTELAAIDTLGEVSTQGYDYIFRATNGKDGELSDEDMKIDGTGEFMNDGEIFANGIIVTGNGKDYVVMGDGNDLILTGNGKDIADGGGGNDIMFGENGKDMLDGGDGMDIVSGGNGDDTLKGGNDNDTLLGGKDNDTIFGGNDEDIIVGGEDNGTFSASVVQEEDDDLIVNGSFEAPLAGPAPNLISYGGWVLVDDQVGPDQVLGWDNDDGGPIELQYGGTGGVQALDGKVKLELDSHKFSDELSGSSPIVGQEVATVMGETYTLNFGAFERTDGTSDFDVHWDGGTISFEFADDGMKGSVVMDTSNTLGITPTITIAPGPDGWNLVTIEGLPASGALTTVGFQATVDGNTVGALIDDISLIVDNTVIDYALEGGDLLQGDELTGTQSPDTFIYDFAGDIDDPDTFGKDGVDVITDFDTALDMDELVIEDLSSDYLAVIIQDDAGDIIAFQNIDDGSFVEDAAIQLTGVDTTLDDLADASALSYVTIV